MRIPYRSEWIHVDVDSSMLIMQLYVHDNAVLFMYSMIMKYKPRTRYCLLPLLKYRIIFNLTNPPWNT